MVENCTHCDAPLTTGGECVVALTLDELEQVIQLMRVDHRHDDFEPECPGCTAVQKLEAARAAANGADVSGVGVGQGQTESHHTPMLTGKGGGVEGK